MNYTELKHKANEDGLLTSNRSIQSTISSLTDGTTSPKTLPDERHKYSVTNNQTGISHLKELKYSDIREVNPEAHKSSFLAAYGKSNDGTDLVAIPNKARQKLIYELKQMNKATGLNIGEAMLLEQLFRKNNETIGKKRIHEEPEKYSHVKKIRSGSNEIQKG